MSQFQLVGRRCTARQQPGVVPLAGCGPDCNQVGGSFVQQSPACHRLTKSVTVPTSSPAGAAVGTTGAAGVVSGAATDTAVGGGRRLVVPPPTTPTTTNRVTSTIGTRKRLLLAHRPASAPVVMIRNHCPDLIVAGISGNVGVRQPRCSRR